MKTGVSHASAMSAAAAAAVEAGRRLSNLSPREYRLQEDSSLRSINKSPLIRAAKKGSHRRRARTNSSDQYGQFASKLVAKSGASQQEYSQYIFSGFGDSAPEESGGAADGSPTRLSFGRALDGGSAALSPPPPLKPTRSSSKHNPNPNPNPKPSPEKEHDATTHPGTQRHPSRYNAFSFSGGFGVDESEC